MSTDYPSVVEVFDAGWGPGARVRVRALVEAYQQNGLKGIGDACHYQLPKRMALAIVDFTDVPWGTLPETALATIMRPLRRQAIIKRGQMAFVNIDEQTLTHLQAHHGADLGLPWQVDEPLEGEAARFIGRRRPTATEPPSSAKSQAIRRATYQALAARDGDACVWCGVPLELGDANTTFDHAHPAGAGGPDEVDNLLLACLLCNAGRRARSLEEWTTICRKIDLAINDAAIEAALGRRRTNFAPA